jgi:hypothetical protein
VSFPDPASFGAFAYGFIAEPFKRMRERRRAKRAAKNLNGKETQVFQGKVTYASIAVLAVSWLAQRFDVPVLPDDAEAVVAAVGALLGTVGGVYGRYRATKQQ